MCHLIKELPEQVLSVIDFTGLVSTLGLKVLRGAALTVPGCFCPVFSAYWHSVLQSSDHPTSSTEQVLELPDLRVVQGKLILNDAHLVSARFPALASVGDAIAVDECRHLQVLDMPVLQTVGKAVEIVRNTYHDASGTGTPLETLSWPQLQRVGDDCLDPCWCGVMIDDNSGMKTVELPSLQFVRGALVIYNCLSHADAAVDLSSLERVVGGFVIEKNDHLASLNLSTLHSAAEVPRHGADWPSCAEWGNRVVEGFSIRGNQALVELDLRRFHHVGKDKLLTVDNNHANILTTLPCSVKKLKRFQIQGRREYWNAYPTLCHGRPQPGRNSSIPLYPSIGSGAVVGGVLATCDECYEYSTQVIGCGEENAACVICDPLDLHEEIVESLNCQQRLTLCRASAKCFAQLQKWLDEGATPADELPTVATLRRSCYSIDQLPEPEFVAALRPVAFKTYVEFSPGGGQSSMRHFYPRPRMSSRQEPWMLGAPWDTDLTLTTRIGACFCPLDQAVCNIGTDLLDSYGNSSSAACKPGQDLDTDLFVYSNPMVTSIDFGDVQASMAAITIVDCEALQTVVASSLVRVGGMLTLMDLPALSSITFPSLKEVGSLHLAAAPALTTLQLPSLENVEDSIRLETIPAVQLIELPRLYAVGTGYVGKGVEAASGYGDLVITGVPPAPPGAVGAGRTESNVNLINLPHLADVFGLVRITGLKSTTVTVLSCSAQTEGWGLTIPGEKIYEPTVQVKCHEGPNTTEVSGSCRVCDNCVECESESRQPVVLDGYVRVVNVVHGQIVAHIFECEAVTGCFGDNVTAGSATCLPAFAGHLCSSCEDGFFMDSYGDGEYFCAECKISSVLTSVIVLAVVATLVAAVIVRVRRQLRDLSDASQAELSAVLSVFRSVWVPIRITMTYAQISGQLSKSLDVELSHAFQAVVQSLSAVFNIADLAVRSECVGLSKFSYGWAKDVFLQPVCLALLAIAVYYHQHRTSKHALLELTANLFWVVFFCYPSIVSKCFAAFICSKPIPADASIYSANEVRILLADDRVLCEDQSHQVLQIITLVVIAVVAIGVPVSMVVFLRREYKELPKSDVRLQLRVSTDFKITLTEAEDMIQDIRFGSRFGYLVGAYKPSCYYWEAVDMFRKLALCGFVLLFDRGGISQLMAALGTAMMFIFLQLLFLPYKLEADNSLRFTTELQNIVVIMIAIRKKADKQTAQSNYRWLYDLLTILSFVVLVAVPFVVVLLRKIVHIRAVMQQSMPKDAFELLFSVIENLTGCDIDGDGHIGVDTTARDNIKIGGQTQEDVDLEELRMVVKRFKLGLHSVRDREVMVAYFDQPTRGTQLWKTKTLVGHLTSEEMSSVMDGIRSRLPRNVDCGLHFTDLDSANLILQSIGIRASTVGQLSGGVSICLATMDNLKWERAGGVSFQKATGAALWGTKAHEVMRGERPAGGHPNWGKYANKLDCCFVVEIPSEEHRDPRRLLPGRPHVYIIPKSDCVEDDGHHFYPNEKILSLFILRLPEESQPASSSGHLSGSEQISAALAQHRQDQMPVWFCCESERDEHGRLSQMRLFEAESVEGAQSHADIVDLSGFPPRVLRCMVQACLPQVDRAAAILQRHQEIERKRTNCQHWIENVERFSDMEMEAALFAMSEALMRSYSLAYHYTSTQAAEAICRVGGGLEKSESGNSAILICRKSPVALGWQAHAGGSFTKNLDELWWGDQVEGGRHRPEETAVLVVLAVPTSMFGDNCDQSHQCRVSAELYQISEELLTADGRYSNAHVQKVYSISTATDPDHVELRGPSGALVPASETAGPGDEHTVSEAIPPETPASSSRSRDAQP